ncbi:MAG: MgtC/SapB family protein [Actinomycetota bacterium]|nr:MgtC/SapB family protein [Actinomycetota bacterium]
MSPLLAQTWLDTGDQLVLAAQVALAALLGAMIGLERELLGKRAGTRTHALVAVGSALAVGLGRLVLGNDIGGDETRVLHGVLTGVGFIGAGTILRSHGDRITGLTTAATVLCAAVIGAACTLGAPVAAALVTLLVLLIVRGGVLLSRLTDVVVERRRARGTVDEDD